MQKIMTRLQQEWHEKTLSYVSNINDFIAKGLEDGWDKAGNEPQEPGREHLTKNVLAALQEQQLNPKDDFRDKWPPAHAPFVPMLENKGQSLPAICLLDDNTILARIGATYQDGYVVQITGREVIKCDNIELFGICPKKRYFAIISTDRKITLTDGWQGGILTTLSWPTGLEGVPKKYHSKLDIDVLCEKVIPFPCGTKALLIGSSGIFILSEAEAIRLYPNPETISEHFDWSLKDHPNDALTLHNDMSHAAISRDGQMIALGCQDSSHLVFNTAGEKIADVGNQSSYPHYAMFSHDDTMVAFNSCHFYNGSTLGVSTDLFPGLETEPYAEDERVTVLDENARVYAAVSRPREFIIGDASGYVRAFNLSGQPTWQLYLGSSVSDMDISKDGRFLLVSTYAGFLAQYDLEAAEKAPHQIGSSSARELKRWIFWKNQPPMLW